MKAPRISLITPKLHKTLHDVLSEMRHTISASVGVIAGQLTICRTSGCSRLAARTTMFVSPCTVASDEWSRREAKARACAKECNEKRKTQFDAAINAQQMAEGLQGESHRYKPYDCPCSM